MGFNLPLLIQTLTSSKNALPETSQALADQVAGHHGLAALTHEGNRAHTQDTGFGLNVSVMWNLFSAARAGVVSPAPVTGTAALRP